MYKFSRLLSMYSKTCFRPCRVQVGIKYHDDRATYKEGVRATYKCARGPPGSKWNLAADTPPLKRVGRSAVRGRRAYKRARAELEMLEREAQPKQKP